MKSAEVRFSSPGAMIAPLSAFLALLLLFIANLAWGWLPQAPSHEELAGYAAKFRHFAQWLGEGDGLSWWIPDYLGGFSAAGMWSYAASMPPFMAAMLFFEPHTAMKVAGLGLLAAAGLAAFAFAARLTGSGWTAFAVGTCWLLAPQALLRLGAWEHLTIVAALPLAPLAFWALLRVADRGSPLDAQLLAMAFSATLLVWTKAGATLLPALAVFAAWLYLTRPDARLNLLRGILWCLPMTVLLGIVPLLPLVREFQFMTVFELGPFAGWQATYSAVTGTAWLDRGGALFDGLPVPFTVNQGGYYLGLAGMFALAAVVWLRWRDAGADVGLGVLRCFTGLALFLYWLSFGPRGVLAGHLELLAASSALPDWIVPVHWLLLAGQGALIWWLLPEWRWRAPAFLVVFAVYLLAPGFRLIELLPIYGDLRAPDSFWMLAGAFCWSVAAGLALAACLRMLPSGMPRKVTAAGVLVFLIWDFSPYAARFHAQGLPPELFADYREARAYLAGAEQPGRVMAVTGRYFPLSIPPDTGRGLASEAAHHNFMPLHAARLEAAAGHSAENFLSWLNVAGISHVFVDKDCPDTPSEYQTWLGTLLPVVFENDHFLILGNREALYPASLWLRAEAGNAPGHALELARDGVLALAQEESPGGEVVAGTVPVVMEAAARRGAGRFATSTGGSAGWVMLAQSWHPDWRAFADGRELAVVRAAGAFPAAFADEAYTAIEFRLLPPWWYSVCLLGGLAGWVVALLGLVGLPLLPPSARRFWTAPREFFLPARPAAAGGDERRMLVIIPTYNEAGGITTVLQGVRAALPEADILVVDDASPDGTGDVVRGMDAAGGGLRLMERPDKLGLASAYRDAFRMALAEDYAFCFAMDADGSHDPADLPRLLAALRDGADLALGSRYVTGGGVVNWAWHRLLLSRWAAFYTRLLTGLPLADATSGLKGVRAAALRRLVWSGFRAEGYGFQVELHYWLWRSGAKSVEVPIRFTERGKGKSKMTARIAAEAALRVLQLAFFGK